MQNTLQPAALPPAQIFPTKDAYFSLFPEDNGIPFFKGLPIEYDIELL